MATQTFSILYTHDSEPAVTNDPEASLPAPFTVNLCPLHTHYTECPQALPHTLTEAIAACLYSPVHRYSTCSTNIIKTQCSELLRRTRLSSSRRDSNP